MEIIIHDSTKLNELQQDFTSHFPYLKLEFFEPIGGSKHLCDIIKDTSKTIGDVRHIHTAGHMTINGHMKTETLEKEFMEKFGISVQVFRKSGGSWLLTGSSDNWTIAEQNRKGKEMSESVQETKDDDFDRYHEQD